jgi:hypothetical protein
MAIDTRDKRSSALYVTSPWRSQWPTPDGILDTGDRQEIAFMYSGISSGPAPPSIDEVHIFPFIANVGTLMKRW